MSLDRYLKRPNLEKVVDPGSEGLPPSAIPTTEGVPPSETNPTPISQLVQDVISASRQTRIAIREVIGNIESTNSKDEGFRAYADLARQTAFDATRLLSDPKARPTVVDSLLLKSRERDVYRRMTDPRAPFLQDLWRMDSEASASEYTMRRLWEPAARGTQLFDTVEDGRLTRFALFKERQYLASLKRQAENVGKLVIETISTSFARSLVQKIGQNASRAGTTGLISPANSRKALRQLDHLLQRQTIELNEGWEKFTDSIASVWGDHLSQISQKLVREQPHVLWGGLRGPILDFVDGFDEILDPLGLPELREFRIQVEGGLMSLLKGVEDDLVQRERSAIEAEEVRAMLWANARRNSLNKAFRNAVAVAETRISGLRDLPDDGRWLESLERSVRESSTAHGASLALYAPPQGLETT